MSKHARSRGVVVSVLAAAVMSLVVGSALAANIAGTAKGDVLRGTAKADRLLGRGGNDKLYGLVGNDSLVGGAGNDVLVGGPGADRLSCGAGYDTARGDAQDRVANDCEKVTGVPDPEATPPLPPPLPPPPPPPPASPITPGSYKGDLDGNFIFFEVRGDRTITGFRSNYIKEDCDQGGFVYGTVDWGQTPIQIAANGTFSLSARGEGSVDDQPAVFIDEITGRFDGTNVTGTYTGTSEFDFDGTHYKCSSGPRPWTASRVS
jgi:hypothetical protein